MRQSEKIARAIASLKALDPDQLGTNYILASSNGITLLPPSNAILPVWEFFRPEALMIMKIIGLEDGEVE